MSLIVFFSTVLSIPSASLLTAVDNAAGADEPTILRVGMMGVIDSMNPYVGLTDAAYVFWGLVYDMLECVDNDLQASPNLAKSVWAVPNDTDSDPNLVGMPYGSVWQYNLTDNAYWSDGEAFTADDVVYNIWLNAEPTHYDSMWAYQPYSYFMKEAWKVDEYTVRISFWDRATGDAIPASYPYLNVIPMLPKHMLENFNFAYIGMNWSGVFSESQSPGMPIVGTGPFMATTSIYSEWLAGNHITLVRNPNYHWKLDKAGAPEVKFDQLILRFFQDSTSMVLALENNQIDVASYPPTAYEAIKDKVESGDLKNVVTYDGSKVTGYWTEIGFSMAESGPNPSRLDPAVRQALHMATNKQYIVDNQYLGYSDVGSTLIAPIFDQWHYEPTASEAIDYSLDAAAALLEANGYMDIDDDGVRECTILSNAVQMGWVDEGTEMTYNMLVRKEFPEEKDIAIYLKSQWSQIGVVVNFEVLDEVTMLSIIYSYNYDSMIYFWSSDADPNYQLFCLSKASWGGWSDCKYYNKAYDDNYSLSVRTLDKDQRKVYTDNCQRVFYNDSAYIIVAYPYQTYAWRNDTFTGWGDWKADPGRTLDNFWSGNPIWTDLVPVNDTVVPTDGDGGGIDVKMVAVGVGVAAAAAVIVLYFVMKGKKGTGPGKETFDRFGD